MTKLFWELIMLGLALGALMVGWYGIKFLINFFGLG